MTTAVCGNWTAVWVYGWICQCDDTCLCGGWNVSAGGCASDMTAVCGGWNDVSPGGCASVMTAVCVVGGMISVQVGVSVL